MELKKVVLVSPINIRHPHPKTKLVLFQTASRHEEIEMEE